MWSYFEIYRPFVIINSHFKRKPTLNRLYKCCGLICELQSIKCDCCQSKHLCPLYTLYVYLCPSWGWTVTNILMHSFEVAVESQVKALLFYYILVWIMFVRCSLNITTMCPEYYHSIHITTIPHECYHKSPERYHNISWMLSQCSLNVTITFPAIILFPEYCIL